MKNKILKEDVVKANKEFYNLEAEEYLENEYYAYTNSIKKDVLKNLKLCAENSGSNDKFLDVACGSGFLSKIVDDNNIFKNGIGVDISEKQVELYNKNINNESFNAQVADVTKLELTDNSIDVAAGYSVLHHFFSYYEVLNEITRVLKPGGIIYFDFEPNSKFQKKMKFLIKLRRKILDNKSTDSLSELESMAEYHNNYEPGINVDDLVHFLSKDYEIIKVGTRIPEHNKLMSCIFYVLSKVSFSFSPNFFIIAKKK